MGAAGHRTHHLGAQRLPVLHCGSHGPPGGRRPRELAAAIHARPDDAVTGDAAVDALLAYTRLLVRDPGSVSEADVDALRAAGWDDLDILDVNDLAAYYAYINRVATGLGLQGVG